MTTYYKLSPHNWLILIVLVFTALAGLFWANYQFADQNPGGVDFLSPWMRGRSFLMEGLSPYSEHVDLRIQDAAYGRPAQGEEPKAWGIYPLYSFLLFAPFSALSNYTLARALWMMLLEISLIATALLALSLVEWRPRKWLLAAYLIFAPLWHYALRAVVDGDVLIIVTLLLTVALLALKHNQDRVAGFLLAFSTITPKLVLLLILFVLLWSLYQRRWKLIKWFLGSLAALIALGIFFIPNWIWQNLWQILRNPSPAAPRTLAAVMGGWWPGIAPQLRWGIPILLGSILLWEWWLARDKNFIHFLWTASLTLVITQWIGIPTDPGNFIYLFPALTLILANWDKRWQPHGIWVVLATLLLLFAGLWLQFIFTLEQTYQPVQHPSMFLTLPAFLLLGLYWIKWWIVRPARLALEG